MVENLLFAPSEGGRPFGGISFPAGPQAKVKFIVVIYQIFILKKMV